MLKLVFYIRLDVGWKMVRKCVRTKRCELWVDQGIQQVLLLWIPLDDPPS